MRSISSSRPITGSILLALAVMSRQYIPKAAAFGAETTDPDPPDRPPAHIIPFVDEMLERCAAKRWYGDALGMTLVAAGAGCPTSGSGGTRTILGPETGAEAAAGCAIVPAAGGAALSGASAAEAAADAAATTASTTLVASRETWRVGLAAAAADVEAAWLRLTGKIETLRYGQRSPP